MTIGTQVAHAAEPTVLSITPTSTDGVFSPMLLGANGRWSNADYGGWDTTAQRARPGYVQALKDSGISAVRFPGGTVASLYHFQWALGAVSGRRAQVSGSDGSPLTDEFGPDEFGRLADEAGHVGGVGVVNFSSGTPREAAEFVSYMTGADVGGRSSTLPATGATSTIRPRRGSGEDLAQGGQR